MTHDIPRICGFCMLKDPNLHTDAGTRTFLIIIHSAPERLQACPEHDARYIEPVRLILHMLGHSAPPEDADQPELSRAPSLTGNDGQPEPSLAPSLADTNPDRYARDCFLCGRSCSGSAPLANHIRNDHNIEPSELFGSRCLVCGKECGTYQLMNPHLGTAHKITVPRALERAEAEGDPFGIVAAVRQRAQAAQLQTRVS